MLGETNVDRVTRRQAAARDEILTAAWSLARTRGVAGFTLRELAAAVGMRAPSLYGYFPNKAAIFDAMFEAGYRSFTRELRAREVDPADPVGSLASAARWFVGFCQADPARYQLMFQRSVPGFVPSESAYGASLEAMAETRSRLGLLGITTDEDVDLWLGIVAGLAAQQVANDPDGDRWAGLADRAAAMFLAHQARRNPR